MCYTEIKVSFYAYIFKNSKCLGHIPLASQIQPHPAVVFLAFSKRVAFPPHLPDVPGSGISRQQTQNKGGLYTQLSHFLATGHIILMTFRKYLT